MTLSPVTGLLSVILLQEDRIGTWILGSDLSTRRFIVRTPTDTLIRILAVLGLGPGLGGS